MQGLILHFTCIYILHAVDVTALNIVLMRMIKTIITLISLTVIENHN